MYFFGMRRRRPRSKRAVTIFPSTSLLRSRKKSSTLPGHPQLSSSPRLNRNIVRTSWDAGCRNSSKQIVFGVWPISSPLKILEKMSRLKNSEANESAASVQPGGSAELQGRVLRSEEHTSELQSLMRISYAVFC